MLSKQAPSAFFGTPLAAILMAGGIDTLVVVGCSTSGCVRATVVDAFSYGLAVVLVSDAVFDRSTIGHEVTLFETGQKYADVVTTDEVVEYLAPIAGPDGPIRLRGWRTRRPTTIPTTKPTIVPTTMPARSSRSSRASRRAER